MCEVEKGHRVKEKEKSDLSERYTIQSCGKTKYTDFCLSSN